MSGVDISELTDIAAAGMSTYAAGRALGVSQNTVFHHARRNGIKFGNVSAIRVAIADMRPAEAVEFLLEILETMTGVDGPAGKFPGISLTKLERGVFCVLYHAAGRTVPRSRIMDALYSARIDPPSDKIIDVTICNLRKALANFDGFRIETVWGVGYRLEREPLYRFPWEGGE